MQNESLESGDFSNFRKHVLASLAEIKRQINNSKAIPTGDYLTPAEVCTILKISKGKFYQFVNDGYLTIIRPDPNGRKTYILRSQIEKLFPKDFIN